MVNLSSIVRFHALRTPAKLAMTYKTERLTYVELWKRIRLTGGLLVSRGIGPGMVVAVMMKNSAAFIEIAFAVSHIGAVFLPLNFRLSAEELQHTLHDARANVLLIDDEFSKLLSSTRTSCPVLRLGVDEQSDSTKLSIEAREASLSVRKETDLYRLLYTSGTTDRAKGVIHTYSNFYWKCMDHIQALGLTNADRLLIAGPLYHVGAFDLPGVSILQTGGSVHILRDFDARSALELIQAEKITGAWLAPVMTGAILALAERNGYDVSSVKWIIGGGERTPERRIREFAEFFTCGRYIDAYGLTESCSGDTMMEAGFEIAKIGSVGRPLAHVEISIRDHEGSCLASDAVGEVCLRGPKITKGYWCDDQKTADSFFNDWFRTGDLGYLDADGFLFLTDRRKDMIISGGENIASAEIERVIGGMPGVVEVAVIPIPHAKWGETPLAVIVASTETDVTHDGVIQFCRGRLAGFKIPTATIFVDSLPRNASGKILKRVLREKLAPSH